MSPLTHIRDHYLPPDREAFRRGAPSTGRIIVIAPTRAACETIEMACHLHLETVLEREHGSEIRDLVRAGRGFGIVAATGTGKTLAIRSIAEVALDAPLRIGVVNREREATPETPTWNVVIVTTGIARRWFQDELIRRQDLLVVDEIHQTSAELELCLALGKRVGCRFIWLSATVDPSFYADYLGSAAVLETSAFDPALAAVVRVVPERPRAFLDERFVRHVMRERRGVAVFLPTRAEVEEIAEDLRVGWPALHAAHYHGGEPIRVIRPFLDGSATRPFLLAMTQAGQSALNVRGLDTVVIYDACFSNVVQQGRNVLTRRYLGPNEILQMAGRVHGRVANGRVYLLSDRDVDFETLVPGPPEFQLAGDSERVALTAAALGVDLATLELPVPLDRKAYRAAVRRLTERGLVADGRLTPYGRDVEAMPVDRPWGELLVHAEDDLLPFVAVAANIDSLHRMTREGGDLAGLAVYGSDHLTAYNLYAEAVNQFGYLGEVYGLPRHLFADELERWAEDRQVLIKAIEDVALGTASVYRTLERPLPRQLPYADQQVLKRLQHLVGRVMPFDLAIGGELAEGERVRLSDASVCAADSAVAGTVRRFADRFGVPRGAMEGTNIPLRLIRQYAVRGQPTVELRVGRGSPVLVRTRATEYHGFVLDQERAPLTGPFPPALADAARGALQRGVLEGATPHRDQRAVTRGLARLDEYWRRSAGQLREAAPAAVQERVRDLLRHVGSWDDFLATPLALDVAEIVPPDTRAALDALPASAPVFGDRVPLHYDLEGGVGVVRLRLREKQAARLRAGDLPRTDRPLRLAVMRGKRQVVSAGDLDELRKQLDQLRRSRPRGRRARRFRR